MTVNKKKTGELRAQIAKLLKRKVAKLELDLDAAQSTSDRYYSLSLTYMDVAGDIYNELEDARRLLRLYGAPTPLRLHPSKTKNGIQGDGGRAVYNGNLGRQARG